MLRSMLSPLVSINDALLTSPSAVSTKSDNISSLDFLGMDATPYEKQPPHQDGFVTTIVDTASFQSLFYDKVQQSKDKLFIIADSQQRQENKTRPAKHQREDWCVVQVDWERTDADDAITKGMYVVKRYVRHSNDAIKVASNQCRFWPEIREEAAPKATTTESSSKARSSNSESNGRRRSSAAGPKKGLLHLVDPTKEALFEKALNKWNWVRETVHLFEEQLVGPFDFVEMGNQHHRISPKIWNELKSNVQQQQSSGKPKIDLESIDRKVLIHWSH